MPKRTAPKQQGPATRGSAGRKFVGATPRVSTPEPMSKPDRELYDRIMGFKKETETYRTNWSDYCEKVEDFLRGNHYRLEREETELVAEGEYPVIHHTWYTIDTLCSQISSATHRPQVVPEDASEFAAVPMDHPWRQLSEQTKSIIGKKTDNEVAAELLNARLDYTWDKSDLDCVFDEALESAAWFRNSFILLGWDHNDLIDGTTVDLLEAKDVIYDLKAPGAVERGRFVAYRFMRTREYVRERWGYEHPGNTAEHYNDDKTAANYDDEEVEVWCWYIRDHSTKKVKERDVETRQRSEPVYDEISGIQVGERPVNEEVEVEVDVEVPKYRGGWRRVYMTDDKILETTDNPNASGRLPIKMMPWYKVPRKVEGMSVYDLEKDANQAMNHSMKYALDNANRSQVKVIYKEEAITNIEDALDNEAHGFIGVETDYGLGEVFQIIPGAPLPEAQVQMMNIITDLQERTLGTVDMRQPNSLPRDVSGRAIEGVQAASQNRLERVKRRWHKLIRECARDMIMNIIEYEDEEKTVVLGRDWSQPAYVSFNPSILRFEDWEFEARWDIAVEAPRNLPVNPVDRNDYLLAVASKLSEMDPMIAMAAIKMLELPKEATMQRIIEGKAAQASQKPPEPTPMDLVQAEAQARQQQAQLETQLAIQEEQTKQEMKIRARSAESVADAMEKVAQILAQKDMWQDSIEVIGLIPKAVNEAWQGAQIDQNQAFQQAMAVQGQAMPQQM